MRLRYKLEILYRADLLLAVWIVTSVAILKQSNGKQMCCHADDRQQPEEPKPSRPDGKRVKSIIARDPRGHEGW